ncbi:hypothetical protein DFP72DRAFT_849889 [Ephemerocybe angulata]|uniref:Uncharacterized protein n=1 Tax=Ephemerocybe angulata TaxID=980116 RepID=A0A8H6HSK4_9AGAR|nr:hypothetical protein DFP72DRAFT_849889 [Tulosesus angulatus]
MTLRQNATMPKLLSMVEIFYAFRGLISHALAQKEQSPLTFFLSFSSALRSDPTKDKRALVYHDATADEVIALQMDDVVIEVKRCAVHRKNFCQWPRHFARWRRSEDEHGRQCDAVATDARKPTHKRPATWANHGPPPRQSPRLCTAKTTPAPMMRILVDFYLSASAGDKHGFRAKKYKSEFQELDLGPFCSFQAECSGGTGRLGPTACKPVAAREEETFETIIGDEDFMTLASFMKDIYSSCPKSPASNLMPTLFASSFETSSPNIHAQYRKCMAAIQANTCGLSEITALGCFKADLGGHVVLWELNIAIGFPTWIAYSRLNLDRHSPPRAGPCNTGDLFRWVETRFEAHACFFGTLEQGSSCGSRLRRAHLQG